MLCLPKPDLPAWLPAFQLGYQEYTAAATSVATLLLLWLPKP